jgi:hypothetical protein
MPRNVHRLMTHLALLAIVLLATLPTLGRMLSTSASPLSIAMPQAMHHAPVLADPMPGMVHDMRGAAHDMEDMARTGHAAMAMHAMHHMPSAQSMEPPPAAPVTHHPSGGEHSGHGEGDCDYCPLLHSLLAMPGVALSAIDEAALPAPQFRMFAAALPWHYPSGLGSRGPPLTS